MNNYELVYSIINYEKENVFYMISNILKVDKENNFIISILSNYDIKLFSNSKYDKIIMINKYNFDKNDDIYYLHIQNLKQIKKKIKFNYFMIIKNNSYIFNISNINEIKTDKIKFNKKTIFLNWKPKWGINIKRNTNIKKICINEKIVLSDKNVDNQILHINILDKYLKLQNNNSFNKLLFTSLGNKYKSQMKKNKIGLLFFGIHYLENYNHWKGIYKIDFRFFIKNIFDKIINYFNKKFDIDIFICTNYSNYLQDLLDIYKPKDYCIIENKDNNILSKNLKLQGVIECFYNYKKKKNIHYSNLIITRFDIFFRKNFENINLNKFNLISILEKNNLICDNFYMFPYKYFKIFYDIILDIGDKNLHFFKNIFENYFNINYIHNEFTDVPNLLFYSLRKPSNLIINLIPKNMSKNKLYNITNTSILELKNNSIIFTKFDYIKNKINYDFFGYYLLKGKYNINFNTDIKFVNEDKIFFETKYPINKFVVKRNNSITFEITENDFCIFNFDNYFCKIPVIFDNLNIRKIKY